MKLGVGELRSPSINIEEPPPICKGSQEGSWITVETMVEVVPGKIDKYQNEQR